MLDESETLAPHNAVGFAIPKNKWSAKVAEKMTQQELLLYRSNLLGSDLTVTNYGGGNTSAKIFEIDPLTRESTRVLWVKGSGGDIGSMKLDGFSTIYLDKLLGLESLYKGKAHEDEMVQLFSHCAFNLNPRPASIDTPLHGFLPFGHIDHVHPDAIIAIAASSHGEKITQKIWGDKIGWLPWMRPGFELGIQLRKYIAANPKFIGVMLAGHGIICWAETSKDCYDNTIKLISDAAHFLNKSLKDKPAFSGPKHVAPPSRERKSIAAKLALRLSGIMSQDSFKIAHFDDSKCVLEFTCSKDFVKLAQKGTSCPDHFLRTKIAPLCLDFNQIHDAEYLTKAIENYRKDYSDYYQRSAKSGDPKMRDPSPVIVLVPKIGMLSFSQDKTTARLASEFYINAINVMRGAEAIGEYLALSEREAFNIEYWALEEAKLQRLPKPKPLVGKVAFITGGAGGIGAACARRLLIDGACVMIADRDTSSLMEVERELKQEFPEDNIRSVLCDVTVEAQMEAAFEQVTLEFGRLDILVANAGIASSASIEDTDLKLWRKNYDVLVEGYFLAARAGFAQMKAGNGGSIIFIGSKNAIAATPNASAYASAKAASLHLARCLALEGAANGIRVNIVNPDAVIKGSKIWSGEWRQERAGTHGIDSGLELEAHYRKRSMLNLDVLPEDVAEAVYFFASTMSAKSTGNMINVDAGNANAFPR